MLFDIMVRVPGVFTSFLFALVIHLYNVDLPDVAFSVKGSHCEVICSRIGTLERSSAVLEEIIKK